MDRFAATFILFECIDIAFFIFTPLDFRLKYSWKRYLPGGGIAMYIKNTLAHRKSR